MKKVLSVILFLAVLISLVGCGGVDTEVTMPTSQTPDSIPNGWINPKLTKETTLYDMTFMAPSNWRSAEATSPDCWYFYPYDKNADGLIYVTCVDYNALSANEIHDEALAHAALSSVLAGITESPYDTSFTMVSNYHAINAHYLGTMNDKKYEHKVCIILVPQKVYCVIVAEPQKLSQVFAKSADDIIATITIPTGLTDDSLEKADGLDWNVLEQTLTTLGAYEIINHTYKEEKNVIVEGIINNITEKSFNLWIPYGNSYYECTDWNYDIPIDGIKDGDVVKVCVSTYKDGSLAKSKGILAIQKIDKDGVLDIVEEFKKTCPPIDYKGIMRNPDKAYGTLCKATGSVIQVIKTTDTMQELLLKLSDGDLVYVAYYKEKGADNILEDDEVTVYGIFYMTETYTTVLGTEKTIPRIPVSYVDIH